MNVFKITFQVNTIATAEILIAELAEQGYYSFEEREDQLDAFIQISDFKEDALKLIARKYDVAFDKFEIEEQNWNEEWEQNFKPVVINDTVSLRADFHEKPRDVQFEIIITPKMSFGTGHHATTYLMIEMMGEIDFVNKSVLDFGTGTGVLAIYAEKKGSRLVTAIDNDQWSINNAKENIEKNSCEHIVVLKKEDPLMDEKFDVILANINTHILLKHVEHLRSVCKKGGQLLISGFISRDLKSLRDAFSVGGFKLMTTNEKDGWYCLLLKN